MVCKHILIDFSRILGSSGNSDVTEPFMRTLKFKAQPTNAFFATVNQVLGGSSQLPTTAERAVIKSLSTVQTTKQCSAVVISWEEPPNVWLTSAKNAFVGWALNFRVRMLLKRAVNWLHHLSTLLHRAYFHVGQIWPVECYKLTIPLLTPTYIWLH